MASRKDDLSVLQSGMTKLITAVEAELPETPSSELTEQIVDSCKPLVSSLSPAVVNLCAGRSNLAAPLYSHVCGVIESYASAALQTLLACSSSEALLYELLERWARFCAFRMLLSRICEHLDRDFCEATASPKIPDVSNSAFCDVVDKLLPPVAQACALVLDREREGAVPDAFLVRDVVAMLDAIAVGVGPRGSSLLPRLEAPIFAATTAYYTRNAEGWLSATAVPSAAASSSASAPAPVATSSAAAASPLSSSPSLSSLSSAAAVGAGMDVPAYLAFTDALLLTETRRAALFLLPDCASALRQAAEKGLLERQVDRIVDHPTSGVVALLRDGRREPLALLYRLLLRVPHGMAAIARAAGIYYAQVAAGILAEHKVSLVAAPSAAGISPSIASSAVAGAGGRRPFAAASTALLRPSPVASDADAGANEHGLDSDSIGSTADILSSGDLFARLTGSDASSTALQAAVKPSAGMVRWSCSCGASSAATLHGLAGSSAAALAVAASPREAGLHADAGTGVRRAAGCPNCMHRLESCHGPLTRAVLSASPDQRNVLLHGSQLRQQGIPAPALAALRTAVKVERLLIQSAFGGHYRMEEVLNLVFQPLLGRDAAASGDADGAAAKGKDKRGAGVSAAGSSAAAASAGAASHKLLAAAAALPAAAAPVESKAALRERDSLLKERDGLLREQERLLREQEALLREKEGLLRKEATIRGKGKGKGGL